MTKLSDFPTQYPKGWDPEGEGVPATNESVDPKAHTSSGSKIRRPAPVTTPPEGRQMSQAECIQYADQGTVQLLRHRIVELRESIEDVRTQGNTIEEWEALVMIIHELERVIVNIPGYVDPARGPAV